MARRWFTLVGSLVLCSLFVTAAVAQDSSDHSTGRSLFNWFGWRSNASDSQQNSGRNQNSGRVRQMPNNPEGTPNWNLGSDQMPPDPADKQSYSLPGLGGSPLPHNATQSARNSSAVNGSNPNGTQSAPSNGGRRYNTSRPSAHRNAVQQLDVSPPSYAPESGATNNSTTSAIRQSPSRRTAPHINPDDLRNELSGTFRKPTATDEPTARTARADEHANTPSNLPPSNQPTKDAQTTGEPKRDAHVDEREPRNAAEAFGGSLESHPTIGANSFVRTPYSDAIPAGPQTIRGKEAFGEALQVASGGDPNVLASNQTPILTTDIRGPKQSLIGREAVYRVQLQNQSDTPAEGIVATVLVPSGADVTNATATQGMVQQLQDAQAKGQLKWQIARLERHASETLELRVVPRESRPLELGVTWTIAPVGSRAVVEVQEPKLQLEIAGPNEVYFNKPQVFKLTISNPGTGPAENVKIELLPPSGKDSAKKEAVTSHPLGDLPPGGSQTVDIELTAREAGKILVKASALAEGGLTCNSSKEVFCRKPELEVDWRGPATKYAGTLATYFFRVRNPGTAPTEDVTVRASLPEGAVFTSASEGQMYDTKQREVVWHVGTLRPGDDNYLELKCLLKNPGANQLKVTAATASGDLTDSKTASTNVVALADLKLDVIDPNGPVAVGSPAMYEIHIKNRGACAAKDINVVGLFSEGIEPEQAEGAMYTVADGRVSFKTIEELPAGRDVVLRIRAHATQPGTHIFRAEVLCRDSDIKLASEETTRFYTDDAALVGNKGEQQAAGHGSDPFKSTVR
jgi:uncharacterized repeat protein (TIGR01451 family)